MEKASKEITLEALKLFAEEHKKLVEKYDKKRDKELEKMKAKFQGQNSLTKNEIDDLYGYENITLEEHDRMLKTLEERDADVLDAETIATPIGECRKMLGRELSNIQDEIWEMSPEEYKQKILEQVQESKRNLESTKKQLGIE